MWQVGVDFLVSIPEGRAGGQSRPRRRAPEIGLRVVKGRAPRPKRFLFARPPPARPPGGRRPEDVGRGDRGAVRGRTIGPQAFVDAWRSRDRPPRVLPGRRGVSEGPGGARDKAHDAERR